MPDTELNIYLRLKDEVSGTLDKVSSSMRKIGSDLRQLGRNLTFIGTSITAPLTLIYKNAAKHSQQIANSTRSIEVAFSGLGVTIAKDLQPVVDKIIRTIYAIKEAYEGLDPQTRQAVLGFVAWAGVSMMVSGIILNLSGRLLLLAAGMVYLAKVVGSLALSFAGLLLANAPLLLAIIAIVAAVYMLRVAWLNNFGGMRDIIVNFANDVELVWNWLVNDVFKPAYEYIINEWNVMWPKMKVKTGEFLQHIVALARAIKTMWTDPWLDLGSVLSRFDSEVEKELNIIYAKQEEYRKKTESNTKHLASAYGDASISIRTSLGDAAEYSGGIWDKTIEQIKKDFESLKSLIAGAKLELGEKFEATFPGLTADFEALEKMLGRIKDALKMDKAKANEIAASWNDLLDKMEIEITQRFAQASINAVSDIFFDGMTTGFKNLKEVAADFGRAMLRIISDVLAKLAVYKLAETMGWTSWLGIIGGLGAGGGGGAGAGGQGMSTGVGAGARHAGGLIRAHAGLALDEVPIIGQRGEGIVSRRGMRSLGLSGLNRLNQGDGGGGQPVVINQYIQAFDYESMQRNRKMIAAMMIEELRANSALRETINTYAR